MSKFRLKILIYSLLLGSVPTVLIGLFSYFIAAKDVEDKVNAGNMHLLQQTRMTVEQMLDSMQRTALQFENSADLKAVMDTKLSEQDFIKVRMLMKEMTNLQTQAILNQVYVVNLKHRWSVDLSGLKSLEDQDNLGELREYIRKPDSIFWSSGLNTVWTSPDEQLGTQSESVPKQPATTLRLVHKIPLLPKRSNPAGMLILQIAAKDIRGLLEPKDLMATQYILDEQGKPFLSSAQDKETYQSINDSIACKISQSGQIQGAFHAESGGKKLSVLYTHSDYNRWTYVSVVTLDKLTEQTEKIALVTAAACLPMLLTVLMAALFGSRKMYGPIRRLHELAVKVVPRKAEGFPKQDELEYIGYSLHSLALSRNELDRQMKSQTVFLREFYVLKLFTGQMPGDDNMYHAERYGFPADWSGLGVLTLEIDNLQQTRFQEQDRELLLFAINNMVAEILPEGERFSPIVLNRTQVTLLTCPVKEPQACQILLDQSARKMKDTVREYLGLQTSIGISNPFRHLNDTARAYKESVNALNFRFGLGPDMIVRYADIENKGNIERMAYTQLKLLEDQIMLALEERRPDQVHERFQRYLDELLSRDGFLREHHLLLVQLASRAISVVQEQGLSMQQVWEGEEELKNLFRLQTRTEIADWFQRKLFVPMIRILQDMADKQFVNITRRMAEIVREQYDKDISLDYCAAVMNFNSAYLSRVFKKEMGIAFSEFLSEYRMNYAKNLLDSTNMKISEIGRKVGYTNISAFIRTFRKTFEMTPGQYRSSSRREKA